jgi:hypothetical protein
MAARLQGESVTTERGVRKQWLCQRPRLKPDIHNPNNILLSHEILFSSLPIGLTPDQFNGASDGTLVGKKEPLL